MSTVCTDARQRAIELRRQRALEALKSGQYKVEKVGPREWKVINGNAIEYRVTVDEMRKPSCSCPDFQNRGLGTCKHVELVRAYTSEASRSAKPAANGRTASAAPSTPHPTAPAKPVAKDQLAKAADRTAKAQPVSQPAMKAQAACPANKPTPTAKAQPASAEDPAEVVVHWGNHKGKKLSEVPESFLGWLAFKMEPRSTQDRVLQQAARALLDRKKVEKKPGKKVGASPDPVAAFIAAAALEIYRELSKAQAGLDDPVVRRGIELRFQATRLVAEELRRLWAELQ